MEANKLIRQTNKPNEDLARLHLPSNWNFEYLNKKLKNYHDKEIIELLMFGFLIECDIHCSEFNQPDNHTGARYFPNEIDAYLAKEINKGTLIGPFDENPFGKHARFSPLNSRPKKESSE